MRNYMVSSFAVAVLAVMCVGPALAAGIQPRVVTETNGEIVVELVDHRAPTTAYVAEVDVALPSGAAPSVDVDPGIVTGGVVPSYTMVVRQFDFRRVNVVHVDIRMPGVYGAVRHTTNPTVTVQYTPAASTTDLDGADPLLASWVVNRDVFPRPSGSNSPDPWLSLSGTWVRLSVADRGMYEVRYADLLAFVAQGEQIGSETFRLFTMNARNQQRALGDPMATWRAGVVMDEVALLVEDGGDGFFGAGDRLVFYGLGSEDWADYYNAAHSDSAYHEHTHAKENVYFLTWDSQLPGTRKRVAAQGAAPAAVPDLKTHLQREYREQDLVADYDYRGDGWLWIEASDKRISTLTTIHTVDLVESRPQVFRTVALSPADGEGHRVKYFTSQGAVVREVVTFDWESKQTRYGQGVPVRTYGSFLFPGANEFRFQMPQDRNPHDESFVAWFSVWYHRRLRAHGDRLAFTSPDTTATVNFALTGFSLAGTVYAFDVTDALQPIRLTGVEVTTQGGGRDVRFSAALVDERRHYEVAAFGAMRRPRVEPLNSPDLRADADGPNMIIVTHGSLRPAAEALGAHRRTSLHGYPNPRVKVVTTQEVYDNFSGGLPDPMAIRNYIKFAYDNYSRSGWPTLAYVLLFGDATMDFRTNLSTQGDLVPTNLNFLTSETYVTDDWFGHLDAGDQVSGHGVLDVAVGRLPAETPEEATNLANRVIGYETAAPRESWRNEIILVADDEVSFFGCNETVHTDQAEILFRSHAPNGFDVRKVYLIDYELISGVKPAARFELLELWNAGAAVINYIGHGNSQQMADEHVFLGNDVAVLNNGLKLPLLAALSCAMGDFANPTARSVSEKLLLRPEGGAIATITASRAAFIGPNTALNVALFDHLSPRRPGARAMPFGLIAAQGKLSTLLRSGFAAFYEDNNWKYNLLTDPALEIATPGEEIRFENMTADTLVAGLRKTLRGEVLRGGVRDASFNGTIRVRAGEPIVPKEYWTRCDPSKRIRYRLQGGTMFDGTADVVGGEFEVSFRVARFAATGPQAFVTAYAHDGDDDAAVTLDSTFALVPPTIADSLELTPLDGAPRVDLRFKSGLQVVKAGETVRAVVRDADGINVLATTNEGEQAVFFDDLPIPIDVGDFFSLDHGGTDTSGVLLFPLPELSFGPHRLVYKVADNFGQTTRDTLSFTVTDPNDYYAQAVLNYPNPFRSDTRFLFQISDRATIRLDIFTVSGRRIRRIEDTRGPGEQWLYWDGRDGTGDEIANGTYLYVARVTFAGLDRPPVVLRGRATKIR